MPVAEERIARLSELYTERSPGERWEDWYADELARQLVPRAG